jgi:hypothetical protein
MILMLEYFYKVVYYFYKKSSMSKGSFVSGTMGCFTAFSNASLSLLTTRKLPSPPTPDKRRRWHKVGLLLDDGDHPQVRRSSDPMNAAPWSDTAQGINIVDGERGTVIVEVDERVEVEVREVAGVVDWAEGEGNA